MQKTAYALRISDWSSDVCSSDLHAFLENLVIFFRDQELTPEQHKAFGRRFGDLSVHPFVKSLDGHPEIIEIVKRSEEHTSELQSLMRISYAVFCLKKKTTTQITVLPKQNQSTENNTQHTK